MDQGDLIQMLSQMRALLNNICTGVGVDTQERAEAADPTYVGVKNAGNEDVDDALFDAHVDKVNEDHANLSGNNLSIHSQPEKARPRITDSDDDDDVPRAQRPRSESSADSDQLTLMEHFQRFKPPKFTGKGSVEVVEKW